MNYHFGGHNSVHKVYHGSLLIGSLGCVGTLESHGVSRPQTPADSGLSALSPVTMWPSPVAWHSPLCPWVLTLPTEASPQDQIGLWPLSVPTCHPPSGSFLFPTWPSVDPGAFPLPVPRRLLQPSHMCLAFSENKICCGRCEPLRFLRGSSTCSPFRPNTRDDCPLGVREALSDFR